jgi:arylsulfatase A-like enzyme
MRRLLVIALLPLLMTEGCAPAGPEPAGLARLTESVTRYEDPSAAGASWIVLRERNGLGEAGAVELPIALAEPSVVLRADGEGLADGLLIVEELGLADDTVLAEHGVGWQTSASGLRLQIAPHPGTARLRVRAAVGADASAVQRLTVLGLSAGPYLRARDGLLRAREGRREGWHPEAVVRAEFGREWRTSLLVTGEGRVEAVARVPAEDAELVFVPTLPWRQPWDEASLRVAVFVGDQRVVLVRQPVQRSTLWNDEVRLDLSPWAGRQVTIRFAVDVGEPRTTPVVGGPGHAVVVVGDPLVRSRRRAVGRPNLLLISLDTLRADHLSLYGYPRPTSPEMEALAAGGVVFERAWSTAAFTLPAHASLLSGQSPSAHGLLSAGDRLTPQATPMLFEELSEAGYRTVAFTGDGFLNPAYGMARGFDVYTCKDPISFELPNAAVEGDRLAGRLDWLSEQGGAPFAAFVHTFICHEFKPFAEDLQAVTGGQIAPLGVGHDSVRRDLRNHRAPPRHGRELLAEAHERAGGSGDWQAMRDHLVDLYDAGLRSADRHLGELFDALAATGLLEHTLVVIVSDHGEELFERGAFGHGHQLHEELLHVPWVMAGPGVPEGLRVGSNVSLADVAPTVAELLGVPLDTSRLTGRSVVGLMDATTVERAVTAELHGAGFGPSRAIRIGDRKLLHIENDPLSLRDPERWSSPRTELYDLAVDPLEQEDLGGEREAMVAELLQRLAERLTSEAERTAGLIDENATDEDWMDAELMRTLEELGYLGGQ